MRFNALVALEPAPSRNGNTYWRFRCDCGKEKEIQTGHVTRGLIKSCGCLADAVRNMSDSVQPTDLNPRTCKICGTQFFGFVNDTRVFCYNCSPRGASVSDAHKLQKRAMKHILVEYKGGKCVECGYDKCEGSLQFHHINEQEKDLAISQIKPNQIDMDKLYKEVDKCVLLCANCHAEKHFVDDRIGFVMQLPPKSLPSYGQRICRVCNSQFESRHPNRNYCYTCMPYGIGLYATKRIRERAVKHQLLQYRGTACFNCGYNASESALHFHHRNPKEKEFGLSAVYLNGVDMTMEKLKAEADKCDVLCANCHFEIHYNDDDFDLD